MNVLYVLAIFVVAMMAASTAHAQCELPESGSVFYHYSQTQFPGSEEGDPPWQVARILMGPHGDGEGYASGAWIDLDVGRDGPQAQYELTIRCDYSVGTGQLVIEFHDVEGEEAVTTIERYEPGFLSEEMPILPGVVERDIPWGDGEDMAGAMVFISTELHVAEQAPAVIEGDGRATLSRLWEEASKK